MATSCRIFSSFISSDFSEFKKINSSSISSRYLQALRQIKNANFNKKEYDFHNFVKKSPNKVVVYDQDKKFEGVLQSKTYNEVETVDYFLTYKSIEVPTGTILKVLDINSNNYSFWIVICNKAFFIILAETYV